MKPYLFLPLSIALNIFISPPASAQIPSSRGIAPDTWAATDALGRTLPSAANAPSPRSGKYVGMFYFLWHNQQGGNNPLFDNTKIISDPARPWGGMSAFHWWGEPAVGHFLSDDAWVHRKNLQMLADAGVDVIFFDATNAFTYKDIYLLICRTAEEIRQQGNAVPRIGFVTHASTGATVTQLYNDFYSKGLYKDLWFQWDGKPIILGDKNSKMPDGSPMSYTVRDFFTWRDSWAWDPGQDKWQWIDKYPQRPGWHTNPDAPEEMPVSVAGHPTDSLGRSYHSDEEWGHGTEPPIDEHYTTPAMGQGIQFAQQWRQALKIDPKFIFITGWNEWIAQRFAAGGNGTFAGRPQMKGGTFFVDNFSEEFSRDIMPMRGGYGDNYYMQLVDGIRRFKGVHSIPPTHGFATIDVAGQFSAWNGKTTAQYLDHAGDTMHRDHDGWGKEHFTNTTGRNDITSAKVACDAKSIDFYVHTRQHLTPFTGANWMQLAIDADSNHATGWNGYDFVVNSRVIDSKHTTLKRLSDGKTWTVRYRAAGSDMRIAIPRALLGLTNAGHTKFDFHWVDSAPVGRGDIANWWYDGDSAPDGRFNYRYENVQPKH